MSAKAPGTGVGIIAGSGDLPRLIAEERRRLGLPYKVFAFDGVAPGWIGEHPHQVQPIEKPGRIFRTLRADRFTHVCFAGAMARPKLDMLRADGTLLSWLPKLLPALRGAGDDALLRLLTGHFEKAGFRMIAAHDLLTGLLIEPGVLTRAKPGDADKADATRGMAILAALSPLDLGQACVVGQGLCLGIETVQGTDALLAFVAANPALPDADGARGVLVKAPKTGQDRRVDMPAIGPETVERAAQAGLAGLVLEAGGVMLLGKAETVAAANAAGLFIWGRT